MSDVRVPQEAIDAAAMAFSARAIPSLVTYAKAESAIAAALPFLRAQWEADLLSDGAVMAAADALLGAEVPRWSPVVFADPDVYTSTVVSAAKKVLRAALGSCVRSEGEDAA